MTNIPGVFTFRREQKAIVSAGSSIRPRHKWEEEPPRAKGTILHEFPLSLAPNKIVKGPKVNGGDGVAGRDNAQRGERKSHQLGDANFMEQQLRKRSFYDSLKENKTAEQEPPHPLPFSLGPLVESPLPHPTSPEPQPH